MAPITALLYCYRLPTLDPVQFRDYIEEKHVPLVKSLLGHDHPMTHTRYYTNKDSGFMLGSTSGEDADLIAVIEYESEEAMQQSMRKRFAEGIKEKIQADEAMFMDRSRIKLAVLGTSDVRRTLRDD